MARRRGPAPAPTILKLMRGAKKSRINDSEAHPRLKMPSCPKQLGPEIRRMWRKRGKELVKLGLLTQIDGAIFAAHLYGYHQWLKACGELIEMERTSDRIPFYRVGEEGNYQFHPPPQVHHAERHFKMFLQAGSLLGLSPSDRSRIKAEKAIDAKGDPFEAFRAAKKKA